jgi:hypothetical protein
MNEQIHDETRQILAELKDLQDSQLIGRVIFLISQIEKSPNIPPEGIETIEAFVNHPNSEIRLAAEEILNKYKG